MKHRVSVVVALLTMSTLFLVSNAEAQQQTYVGVKGGVNLAQFLGGTTSGLIDLPDFVVLGDLKDTRTGFTGGAFITSQLTNAFGIQLEALYTQKGGSGRAAVTRDGTTFINTDVTVELDYLEFPVLGAVFFPLGNAGTVSGFGGIYLAFRMSAEAVVEVAGTTDSIDISSLINGVDYGVILGLGAAFNVSAIKVVVDGRWSYGADSINNTTANLDIHNSALTVMLGFAIPLGKPQ